MLILKRMELLISCCESFGSNFIGAIVNCNSQSLECTNYFIADTLLDIIAKVQTGMKAFMTPTEGFRKRNLSKKECISLAKVRASCSTCRKGCIAAALSLLNNVPKWIYMHICFDSLSVEMKTFIEETKIMKTGSFRSLVSLSLRDMCQVCSQDANNIEKFWDLSINILSTPLLFPSIAKAINLESDKPQSSLALYQLFKNVREFLVSALNSIERYSINAALDITQTISDFCSSGLIVSPPEMCSDVDGSELDDALLLCSLLLEAYQKCPKLKSSEDACDWRCSVLDCLRALFKLKAFELQSGKSSPSISFLAYLNKATVLARLCSDIKNLYSALGVNISADEINILSTKDIEDANILVGTTKSDKQSQLLYALSLTLINLLELMIVSRVSFSAIKTENKIIERFTIFMEALLSRNIVFEDEVLQREVEIAIVDCINMLSA
jgi:hypothetical protein